MSTAIPTEERMNEITANWKRRKPTEEEIAEVSAWRRHHLGVADYSHYTPITYEQYCNLPSGTPVRIDNEGRYYADFTGQGPKMIKDDE